MAKRKVEGNAAIVAVVPEIGVKTLQSLPSGDWMLIERVCREHGDAVRRLLELVGRERAA